MRAYLAKYNDAIYCLKDQNLNPRKISRLYTSHSQAVHRENERTAVLKICISDMDTAAPSNKEYFDELVAELKNKRTTSIDQLSPMYRIYVEYSLVDEGCGGKIVDKGVGIKDVSAESFLYLLGLNDENELVSRLGIDVSTKIRKTYRDMTPYGAMKVPHGYKFVLYVERVYLAEIPSTAFSIIASGKHHHHHGCGKPHPGSGGDNFKYHPHCSSYHPYGESHGPKPSTELDQCECAYDREKDPYVMRADHPSMNSVIHHHHCTVDMKDGDAVIIYDTYEHGISFEPLHINYKPMEICLDIRFLIMKIAATTTEAIYEILEENADLEENPDSGDNDNPIIPDPDNPDKDPDTDPENPDDCVHTDPITDEDIDNMYKTDAYVQGIRYL